MGQRQRRHERPTPGHAVISLRPPALTPHRHGTVLIIVAGISALLAFAEPARAGLRPPRLSLRNRSKTASALLGKRRDLPLPTVGINLPCTRK